MVSKNKAPQYEIGTWVDESFPRDDVLKALRTHRNRIDVEAFTAYLGPRLGMYRVQAEKAPAPSEELQWVEDTLAAIDALKDRLGHLPPTVRTEIALPCVKRNGVHFGEFRKELDGRLKEVWNLLVLAERGVESGKKASPATVARDWLAADLAQKVTELDPSLSFEQACEIVCVLLGYVGVKVGKEGGDAKYLQTRIEAFNREREGAKNSP